MSEYKWFAVPGENIARSVLVKRLQDTGFQEHDGVFVDAHERTVAWVAENVRIGIPVSDILSEQEQLEFLLSILDLDEDNVQQV